MHTAVTCACLQLLLMFGTDAVRTIDNDHLVANYSADIILGGLLPIHFLGQNTDDCGAIALEDGVPILEAIFYSLDDINKNYLNGFTMGINIVDTCYSETVALRRSLDFVTSERSAADDVTSVYVCADGSTPSSGDNAPVVGVIGAASSSVSIQVASFLQLFKIPQVSYHSTSPDLSDPNRYGYFLRTVPSDTYQARAIISILRHFNWTYVSAVYDDSNYGTRGWEEIEAEANMHGICFAFKRKIRRHILSSHSHNNRSQEMDDIIDSLVKKVNSTVVIMYMYHDQAQELFMAADRRHVKFTWIGSDAWSARDTVAVGHEHVVEGAISVQPLGGVIERFDDYFRSLHPLTNTHNPWFDEFWEGYFNCSLGGLVGSFPRCTGLEEIPKGWTDSLIASYARDAIYSYGVALSNLHQEKCGANYTGICPEFHPTNISGPELLEQLENVSFIGTNGMDFSFLNGGDGPPLYAIQMYTCKDGRCHWHVVGNYSHSSAGDIINLFDGPVDSYATSSCSPLCASGEAKLTLENDECCWICVKCTYYQYLVTESMCENCPYGSLPNDQFTGCDVIPEEFVSYEAGWTIAILLYSVFGVVAVLTIAVLFFRYRQTPVIKAASIEMSFVLLVGIASSFLASFAFVAAPSAISCGFTRFSLGFGYTLCYGSIFIKINRIARIFQIDADSPSKPRCISPGAQIILTSIIVGIEIIVLVVWIVVDIPSVTNSYPSRYDNIRMCTDAEDASYLIALAYPLLLVILCTVYAVKSRKTPDGFNETRFITFCSYSTSILWLSFIPVYFASRDHVIRAVTLCVSMSFNATVIILCLFVPKIYIILARPHKNTKEAVMSRSSFLGTSPEESMKGKDMKSENPVSTISSPEFDKQRFLSEMDETELQGRSFDSGCYDNNAMNIELDFEVYPRYRSVSTQSDSVQMGTKF